MQAPLFVRPRTSDERATLEGALRSSSAFTVRRCHILLASAEGHHTTAIAHTLRCTDQTVRNAIHACNQGGLAALQPPASDPAPGQWRNHPCRLSPTRRALEAGQALDYESRPGVCAEKKRRDRLIRLACAHPRWALGCADEGWWSRLAQPDQQRWAVDDAVTRLQALERPTDERDPTALAWYGLLVRRRPQHADQMVLRFVDGRPVSAVTIDCLAWWSERLAAQGSTGLLLIWDNATWHTRQAVRRWLRAQNQTVKQTGQGVRIVSCLLPAKSPWLNPIEPKWIHGKRAISEADRTLSANELEARAYA